MAQKSTAILYASGEVVQIGDHVKDDTWTAVVEDIINSPEDIADWGVDGPGIMLNTVEAGFVFEAYLGDNWEAIALECRSDERRS